MPVNVPTSTTLVGVHVRSQMGKHAVMLSRPGPGPSSLLHIQRAGSKGGCLPGERLCRRADLRIRWTKPRVAGHFDRGNGAHLGTGNAGDLPQYTVGDTLQTQPPGSHEPPHSGALDGGPASAALARMPEPRRGPSLPAIPPRADHHRRERAGRTRRSADPERRHPQGCRSDRQAPLTRGIPPRPHRSSSHATTGLPAPKLSRGDEPAAVGSPGNGKRHQDQPASRNRRLRSMSSPYRKKSSSKPPTTQGLPPHQQGGGRESLGVDGLRRYPLDVVGRIPPRRASARTGVHPSSARRRSARPQRWAGPSATPWLRSGRPVAASVITP